MYKLFIDTLSLFFLFFFFNDPATTEIYTLSLHDALPISAGALRRDANALLDALFDSFDGVAVADTEGDVLARGGERRLWIPVGGHEHPVTAATFFQSNRHLLDSLHAGVER